MKTAESTSRCVSNQGAKQKSALKNLGRRKGNVGGIQGGMGRAIPATKNSLEDNGGVGNGTTSNQTHR
jgi:hypothetical protein